MANKIISYDKFQQGIRRWNANNYTTYEVHSENGMTSHPNREEAVTLRNRLQDHGVRAVVKRAPAFVRKTK